MSRAAKIVGANVQRLLADHMQHNWRQRAKRKQGCYKIRLICAHTNVCTTKISTTVQKANRTTNAMRRTLCG